MRKWLRKLSGLGKVRRGLTTAEYALIVALVVVSFITIIILISGDHGRGPTWVSGPRAVPDRPVNVTDAQNDKGEHLTNF